MCFSTSDGFELATPVLLVDGYNMCGYWPKLKKHFSRGQLDTARDKLVHELITFAHIKGNSKFASTLEMYIDNACGHIPCMLGTPKDISLACLDSCVEV